MKICYGITNNLIDVTDICLKNLTVNNIITIPSNDYVRAQRFSDPLKNVLKCIYIITDNFTTEYDDTHIIQINLLTNTVIPMNNESMVKYINKSLCMIHSKLKINYGNLNEEVPEQKMVVRYLPETAKVLEIGGNIGRNSLVMSSILKDTTNLLTLECDENISKQLTENRDLNNFKFNIECSALSKRKLIQKMWDSIPSDTLKDGYNWVNTITLEELNNKYNIDFDTLVIDCEGAFFYILMDMPEILNNIKLIIMENDYHDISHKQYIDNILKNNNFYVEYVEAGGWGPCYNNFYEVWKKD